MRLEQAIIAATADSLPSLPSLLTPLLCLLLLLQMHVCARAVCNPLLYRFYLATLVSSVALSSCPHQ